MFPAGSILTSETQGLFSTFLNQHIWLLFLLWDFQSITTSSEFLLLNKDDFYTLRLLVSALSSICHLTDHWVSRLIFRNAVLSWILLPQISRSTPETLTLSGQRSQWNICPFLIIISNTILTSSFTSLTEIAYYRKRIGYNILILMWGIIAYWIWKKVAEKLAIQFFFIFQIIHRTMRLFKNKTTIS